MAIAKAFKHTVLPGNITSLARSPTNTNHTSKENSASNFKLTQVPSVGRSLVYSAGECDIQPHVTHLQPDRLSLWSEESCFVLILPLTCQ